ncbi:MAG: cell envelope integrity protein TolA [Deltaproteobacteria bacterium]|nr:cell envelope integrity protein TolA [Deltaproteobacteria bacterium]
MINDLLKHRRGASPQMLALSVALHLIAIVFLITSAKYFSSAPTIIDQGITNVKLVETGPIAPHVMEQAPNQPLDKASEIPPIESVEPAKKLHAQAEKLKTVFAKAEPTAPAIQIKKRRQKPEKIEQKKKAPDPKSKTDKPKNEKEKNINSNDFLEKRLAAIKRNLDSRKSEKSKSMNSSGLDTPAGAGSSNDNELNRWFDAVRSKINSHWSVLVDEQKASKVTIISVQLGDDGRLLDASIDSSSGDRFFDSSAMRAVYQAAPFPTMSREVSEKIKGAGGLALRFTPGGLQ